MVITVLILRVTKCCGMAINQQSFQIAGTRQCLSKSANYKNYCSLLTFPPLRLSTDTVTFPIPETIHLTLTVDKPGILATEILAGLFSCSSLIFRSAF